MESSTHEHYTSPDFDTNEFYLNEIYNKESISKSIILKGTYKNAPIYCKIFYDSEKNLVTEKKIYSYIKEQTNNKPCLSHHFIIPVAVFSFDNLFSLENNIDSSIFYQVSENLHEFKKGYETIHGIITSDHEMEKFNDFIIKLIENNTSEDIYNNLFFELLYSIYIMNIDLGIMHNDLHFGNIMVKKLDSPLSYTYIINNNRYVLTKYFIIRIYDFDQSYVKSNDIEIINSHLNKKLCKKLGSCNKNSDKDSFVLLILLILLIFIINKYLYVDDIVILFKNIFDILTNKNDELYFTIYNNLITKKVFWSAFCNIDREKREFIATECSNTTIDNIDIKTIIDRYLTSMNVTPIDETVFNKYIKYKQKYLALKNTIKN
jgi:hypothetical protein